jgi:hypothetical protein
MFLMPKSRKPATGITFNSRDIDWKSAQDYVRSWKQGELVKWAGSRWTVDDVTYRGALLSAGSIKLEIAFRT